MCNYTIAPRAPQHPYEALICACRLSTAGILCSASQSSPEWKARQSSSARRTSRRPKRFLRFGLLVFQGVTGRQRGPRGDTQRQGVTEGRQGVTGVGAVWGIDLPGHLSSLASLSMIARTRLGAVGTGRGPYRAEPPPSTVPSAAITSRFFARFSRRLFASFFSASEALERSTAAMSFPIYSGLLLAAMAIPWMR